MSRELHYQALILKKQPFGEGDEIISIFTREAGKVRLLAKSVKLQKSKLQSSLQALFVVDLTVAASRGSMPKIISATVKKNFACLRESLSAVRHALYAVELTLKFTADEHKNAKLFEVLLNFLSFLDEAKYRKTLKAALAKFKLAFLQALGLGLSFDPLCQKAPHIGFSLNRGGFSVLSRPSSQEVPAKIFRQFVILNRSNFADLSGLDLGDLSGLQKLLSDFIEYYLEREVKSEKYLNNVM